MDKKKSKGSKANSTKISPKILKEAEATLKGWSDRGWKGPEAKNPEEENDIVQLIASIMKAFLTVKKRKVNFNDAFKAYQTKISPKLLKEARKALKIMQKMKPSVTKGILVAIRAAEIINARADIKKKDFNISDHVTIYNVRTNKKPYVFYLHTHGMYLFRKPELEIYGVPEKYLDDVQDFMMGAAILLVKGANIKDGHTGGTEDDGIFVKYSLRNDADTLQHYSVEALEMTSFQVKGEEIINPALRAIALYSHKKNVSEDILTDIASELLQNDKEVEKRTFIQTPLDRLKELNNSYSVEERLFQQGKLQLVDLKDKDALSDITQKARELHRKEKSSVHKTFLENETKIKSLSIIIPVRGRKRVLLECFDSILRQTFVKHHPDKVEIIIIQDGYVEDQSDNPVCNELSCRARLFPLATKFRFFKLKENRGRSTARNVGVYYASHEIGFFIDSSMILEQNFLEEHMLRHQRISHIALLGFKQNITWDDYKSNILNIQRGNMKPDYRTDLKYCHILKKKEAGFTFRHRRYKSGDKIHYMNLTNNFKNLNGVNRIGRRTLPTFFQTNIASVQLENVQRIGGFEGRFDSLWGFEDSFLGALLFVTGVKIVPCPSSLAFKIEHEESRTKFFDIIRQRQQFDELLSKKEISMYTKELLEQKIDALKLQGILQEEKL